MLHSVEKKRILVVPHYEISLAVDKTNEWGVGGDQQ